MKNGRKTEIIRTLAGEILILVEWDTQLERNRANTLRSTNAMYNLPIILWQLWEK